MKDSLYLTKQVFDLCKVSALIKEFTLCDQLKRAVVSVPANIAEGYGRNTKKDFAQFLSIALGSCNEMIALLDIVKLNFDINDIDKIKKEYQILSKKIYSFRRYLHS